MEWETILVVDADTTARSKLYEVFFSKGHEITCVPTGKEAMSTLTERRFGIILLDGMLPDMTTLDIVKAIRNFDQDVKIAVLDARGISPEEQALLRDARVTAVIPKDFTSPGMMREIFNILRAPDMPTTRPPSPRLSKEMILVVDDNEEVRKTLALFLKKKGYRVDTAISGVDALMKIKSERPDIVFLDFRMPGMDGIMALREIKRLDESIKVVMLTSVQDEYIIAEAAKEGAGEYLIKPCDLHSLDRLLAALIAR